MNGVLTIALALMNVQSWTGFDFMGVHGAEFVVADHTAIVVQCSEEQEQILVTVHVPHEESGPSTRQRRTLYVQLDGGDTQTIEKTDDRPFPGVFQFEPEEWLVDFLLAGGSLAARFEGVTLEAPVDGAFMTERLDHCTGGRHAH